MLRRATALLFALVLSAHGAEGDFRPIFNGRDLTGWEGDPRFWSVRAGAIRGETTLGSLPKENTFLIWRGGTVRDFELRLKFRIQNGNSGVQYRSRELRRWVLAGYQAEVENSPGKVGFLYEERGRKFLANVGERVVAGEDGRLRRLEPLGDRQRDFVQKGYYRMKDWNDYRIVAQGKVLQHWLNGVQTVEFRDEDGSKRADSGLLGLQIHVGPPMVVEFKDLLLQER